MYWLQAPWKAQVWEETLKQEEQYVYVHVEVDNIPQSYFYMNFLLYRLSEIKG